MSLADDVELLLKHIQSTEEQNRVDHNSALFDIYEGNLLKYILEDIKAQFSPKAQEQIQHRLAPINILIKYVDKLSKIYQQNPKRMVSTGEQRDKDALEYYTEKMNFDVKMNNSNEFYNLFKNTLIEPFLHRGMPRLRAIPSDMFWVWSNDMEDPNFGTHVAVSMGKDRTSGKSKAGRTIYRAYTDDEFLIFDSEGDIRQDIMQKLELDNDNGENPVGRIPFTYANMSQNLLTPQVDSDVLKMVKVLPILISDLNYSVMYQAFSLVYGINVDTEGIEKNPDSFIEFRSSKQAEGEPKIGIIKPEVDINEVLNLVQSQFSFWLNTRGVRAGSIGQVSAEQFASGISKLIDEMDTFEARQKQVVTFQAAEQDLWSLILNHMDPFWRKNEMLDVNAPREASDGVEVKTEFPMQLPMIQRGQTVTDLEKERDAGFISTKRAIQKLNPRMDSEEIDELIAEIKAENGLSINLEDVNGGTGV